MPKRIKRLRKTKEQRREIRNSKIRIAVDDYKGRGYTKEEAFSMVAEEWALSFDWVRKIYFKTN